MHCIKGCKCLLNTLIPLGSNMTLAKYMYMKKKLYMYVYVHAESGKIKEKCTFNYSP